MNDSPGWASPGPAPSDDRPPENSGSAEPTGPAEPADQAPDSKWSKEQPPAAQWSAPSTPPPRSYAQTPPGQGGYGQGGYGPQHGGHGPQQGGGWGAPGPGGWGGPPPAAKPGVVPLRPLGVGDILDGAVSTMRAHWRTVLGITVTVAVLIQVANTLIQHYLLPEPLAIDPSANNAEALRQAVDEMQNSLLSMGPTLAITLVGTLFTTALLTVVVSRSVLGRPVTLADAWQEAKPRLAQLLGLTLLLAVGACVVMTVGVLPGLLLGSGGGAALAALGGLAGFVVMVWLLIRFSLASPALMLERQTIGQALRRSAKLVQGSWWRIFGITLLTMLLTGLVSLIISMLFSFIAFLVDGEGISNLLKGSAPEFGWGFLIITGIGAVIAMAITYPISAGVTVLLYIDQRIRREALDLDLARAAGLSDYGTEQPTHPTPGS
ncbi:glycerophosphoryl diester phosphodiesterase membrane domain-containing protein [Streptomyces sp. NPDC051561]|uniref:glycerophosphoryl diester phosphodiesterase membrane domain-containing protein n=1 Tax=Streptomyces sp. NPDC051561 TaxID=3365658 RepID=UPI003790066C